MMRKKHYFLLELSEYLGAELRGDPQCVISGIAPLDKAMPGQISFIHDHYLNDPKYKHCLGNTGASAVMLSPKYSEACGTNQLIMSDPYVGYAKIAGLFAPVLESVPGVHPTAVVGKNCQIANTAMISPYCVLADGVSVGEGTYIGTGVVIGASCTIGSGCILHPRVTLYSDVRLGDRVILHSGSVIGSDGFGMVNDQGIWRKIPQLGGVILGDDVEVGANTTIDRGALEDTVIGSGVKLDNQIQIGHNVYIGDHTVIAGCSGVAGSTRIGKHCMIGGSVKINGHIEIADGVILTAACMVSSSIRESGMYSSGVPSQKTGEWRKNAVRFKQLDELARRVKKLEQTKL